MVATRGLSGAHDDRDAEQAGGRARAFVLTVTH
jgi:hypothetical protein